MSRQLGLIAVNGVDAFALADGFPSVPQEWFNSSGRWAWVRFDPEDPRAEALRAETAAMPLGRLGRPFLVILAEADKSWRMSLYPPEGAPLNIAFHNEIYRPSSLPPGPEPKRSVEEWLAKLDASLPEAFQTPEEVLQKGRDQARAKGLEAVKRAQARRVGDLLNELDDMGDGDEVRRVLTGEACSPDERIGPFNVLPKFLDTLWLGKALLDEDGRWRVGPEAESVGSFDRPRSMYESAPRAEPIPGGPVELPASDLARFWLLPWFCETDSEMDLLIEPGDGTRVPLPRLDHWVTIHRRGFRTYVEVAWNPPGPRASAYRELCGAIATAPAGTVVELISGNMSEEDDDTGYVPLQAASQRYRGTLTDRGTFLLTHSSVPAKPGDFLAAMEICRQLDEPKPSFEMASELDVRGVVELARGTDWFANEKALPRVKGKTVTAASRSDAMATAMMVFRKRFKDGPWDTGAVQERDEEDHQEWETMIDKVGKTMTEVLAAPAGDDVILRTDRAVFRRADWSKMSVGFLDALAHLWGRGIGEDEPAPRTAAEKLEPVDRAFSDLGFTMLGDVHCDRFGELHIRGYAGPSGDTYGCIAAGTFGQFTFEFVTQFKGRGSLTTSTTPNLKDKTSGRVYKRSFPTLTPAALYKEHQTLLAKLTAGKVEPLPAEATVEDFCRALDDYIKREL